MTENIRLACTMVLFLFYSLVYPQSSLENLSIHQSNPIGLRPVRNEVDISDLLRELFKGPQYDQTIVQRNEMKVHTTILPAIGYALQTGLAVSLGAGIAFFTETGVQKRISSIVTSINYTQFKQLIFPVTANIWTKGNKFNINLDYKFLKYPSKTYGLGARTTDDKGYTMSFDFVKLHQTLLKQIAHGFYAGMGFYHDYFWNIKEIDPPLDFKTSFQLYGNQSKEISSGVTFKFLYDTRQNPINAKNGSFGSIVFRPNLTLFGSDNNWSSLQMEYRKYIPVSANKRNVIALWSYNWLTIGSSKPPYLMLPSTGWDDQSNLGRGYIQGRFRAREMIYAEAEYRFGITCNDFIGGVVFVNAQSYSRYLSTQLSVIAPATGAGMRFKLNKYSNTNLSLDYAFGLHGSNGLFFNLGEVFE